MQSATSHKRIAKNTVALYIRGIISVIIGLYTSRVIIDTLGVDDYGVYGVAGGFVGILAFLNSAMSGATSRFITYEMGVGDHERTKATFASTLTVHAAIALIVLIICEGVGVWFLNTRLNIPQQSMAAANWVFQLSIVTAAINITQVPYTALIISHERMNVYAIMEIVNVSLKLVIVYFLLVIPGNKLIVYAVLTALVVFGVAMAYRIYCVKHFKESRVGLRYDKEILKPILRFSGWDLYGNMCVAFRTQGLTFLLNIFFGVAINGAAAIATQLNGTISGFSNNVATAVRPQIIKNYAQKNWREFQQLIEFGCQSSFLLLAIMIIPVFIEAHYIIRLWLGDVPAYVVVFLRIILVTAVFNQLVAIINIGIHATGRIKSLSFISGTICLVSLGIVYLFFRNGFDSPAAFYIVLASMAAILAVNVFILKSLVAEINVFRIFLRLISLPLICVPAGFVCVMLHYTALPSFVRLLAICCCSASITGVMTVMFVLNKEQRMRLKGMVMRKLRHSE